MYSAYKLNKQGDDIQPWHTPFPIWNQSVVPSPVLTAASWPAYRFLKRQVRWSGISISWRIFHSLLWSTQSKALALYVMLKTLQARLQQYVNCELSVVQAGFRKGRGTRDQIANICWIIEKAREFQKNTSISALLTMPKPLTVWITINCEKFRKRWEYQTTWPASWETYMQVRKQQLELDMEQQTGSK